MKKDLLAQVREGRALSKREQAVLILRLSLPAILAQLSSVVMQYIDAAMVGRLGKNCSASIGLVSSSTWLIGGICTAVNAGFTVQIAHFIGAGKEKEARNVVKEGILTGLCISMLLLLIAASVSRSLPVWLGGEPEICRDAARYFLIYSLTIPVHQLNRMASGMLQCSGNMRLPSALSVIMCSLDVIFNFLLIFPTANYRIFGKNVTLCGAGLGVTGAALGTSAAEFVIMLLLLWYLLKRSPMLHLRRGEKMFYSSADMKKALRIGIPVGLEQVVTCSAYIAFTKIVAPLKSAAIAANSFAVTAESLCYMPGYGIGSAATSIVGQGYGAGKKKLAKDMGWLCVGLGTGIMALSGILMFFLAPFMMGLLTPEAEIQRLGTQVLRIEMWAEPLYGASIVVTGVLRGFGDTKAACILNFCSMWMVRIPLAAVLAGKMGLPGVWFAMCAELCVRGILFLFWYAKKRTEEDAIPE